MPNSTDPYGDIINQLVEGQGAILNLLQGLVRLTGSLAEQVEGLGGAVQNLHEDREDVVGRLDTLQRSVNELHQLVDSGRRRSD